MLRDHKLGICDKIRGPGSCGRERSCEVLQDHGLQGVGVGQERSWAHVAPLATCIYSFSQQGLIEHLLSVTL